MGGCLTTPTLPRLVTGTRMREITLTTTITTLTITMEVIVVTAVTQICLTTLTTTHTITMETVIVTAVAVVTMVTAIAITVVVTTVTAIAITVAVVIMETDVVAIVVVAVTIAMVVLMLSGLGTTPPQGLPPTILDTGTLLPHPLPMATGIIHTAIVTSAVANSGRYNIIIKGGGEGLIRGCAYCIYTAKYLCYLYIIRTEVILHTWLL